MFERLKRKATRLVEREIKQQVRESANEGRIHTGAIAVAGIIMLGVVATSRSGSNTGNQTININIYNDNWEE